MTELSFWMNYPFKSGTTSSGRIAFKYFRNVVHNTCISVFNCKSNKALRHSIAASHLEGCVLWRSHSKGAYVIEAVSFQKSKWDTTNATFCHRNASGVSFAANR